MNRTMPEYNLAMGECMMNLDKYKDAIIYFGTVVKHKPKSVSGWEALLRCLIKADMLEEAYHQCIAALIATAEKPIFYFYASTLLFAMGKSKEALLKLETAMDKAPKFLKKFIELNPSILQNSQVVDIIARYKKGKKI
jgi:tetratricopeptide (TPR) repeat protein